MRVIVTRPERDAQRWVRDLGALGFQAQALPLIEIAALEDQSALQAAVRGLATYSAVMFVSGNAVAHFFSSDSSLEADFSAQSAIKTRAWATGPGTARALLRAGVAPLRIDAPAADAGQFDSDALWHLVANQIHAGDRVLIVRGTDLAAQSDGGLGTGRDWLARRLEQVGASVHFVAAYRRLAPELTSRDLVLARRSASDGSVWLFSSAQAVANLVASVREPVWACARALATHPRIALAATGAGFGEVQQSRPALADVAAWLGQHFRMIR